MFSKPFLEYINKFPFWVQEIAVSCTLSSALAVMRTRLTLLSRCEMLISLSIVSVLCCAIIFLVMGALGVFDVVFVFCLFSSPFFVTIARIVVSGWGRGVGLGVSVVVCSFSFPPLPW